MANNGFIKRLQNFFGWEGVAGSDRNVTVEPVKVRQRKDQSDQGNRFTKTNFPSEIKRYWDWYLSETSDTVNFRKKRTDRYTDLDYMVYNEPIMSMAVGLYADEASQIDDQMQIIKVNAKNPAVAKEIRELFDRLGINQAYIRETAWNLVLYGDSFDIISSTPDKGVTQLTSVDVYDVKDRLEFKSSEIEKRYKNINHFYDYFDRQFSVKQYVQNFMAKNPEDPSAAYIPYLFGFVLGEDTYLAPWQVLHYRLNSNRSEFFPFGRPLFINLVGPFRQLRTAMNFMGLARPMSFPKSVFAVDTSEEMTASEKWEAVNEARQEYSNLGKNNKAKEQFALGEEVWVPKDLIDFESIKTDVNLDEIADIELLRDNLIMGTSIPKGYLIVDQGGWGTSNQALLQQSKPFARACFRIQSEILERLGFLVKLHFMMTGKFDKEFTEFELTMNFPVVEEAEDRQRSKKDSLDFANDIINALKDAIGYDQNEVPVKLVKQVFSKYSFMNADEVDAYIKLLQQAQDMDGENPEDEERFNENFMKKYASRINEQVLDSVYFEVCEKHNMTDFNKNGRHVHLLRNSCELKENSDVFTLYHKAKDPAPNPESK